MAQVYREMAAPKLKNLERAGFIIFLYSLIFTAGVAFFASPRSATRAAAVSMLTILIDALRSHGGAQPEPRSAVSGSCSYRRSVSASDGC